MSPFHSQTAGPISTKFCTDLPTNLGKVLYTTMALPTRPPDPGPKPKQITGEKTLLKKKCPDRSCRLTKFFTGSVWAWLASLRININPPLPQIKIYHLIDPFSLTFNILCLIFTIRENYTGSWFINVYQRDYLYLCPTFKCSPLDQSPTNFAQTSTSTQGRFLTQVWHCQPDPLTSGYPKLQNLNRSMEKKLCVI